MKDEVKTKPFRNQKPEPEEWYQCSRCHHQIEKRNIKRHMEQ